MQPNQPNTTAPLACDLTAIPAEARAEHAARAEHLFSTALQERQELPDGYAFRYRPEHYPLLAEFIANERLCCPFFRFTLEVTPEQGPIWLRITGGEGVKDFMQAELGATIPRTEERG